MERGKARGNKSNIASLTPRRVTLQIIKKVLKTLAFVCGVLYADSS